MSERKKRGSESEPAAWKTASRRHGRHCVSIVCDGILKQKDASLRFESADGQTADIPVCETGILNIYADVTLDSGALRNALENGTSIHVFSSDDRLIGSFMPNSALREPLVTHKQLMYYYNERKRLALVKQFLLASFHNARHVIRYYNRQAPKHVYREALDRIDLTCRNIKSATGYDALLLLEAGGRKAYYDCFDSFLAGSGFVFERRSRRPPENEVNAMLGFCYTLLYRYIATEINKTALDVRVGFLHATNARLESLNLDIAEIFKPLVADRCVLALINRKAVTLEMFRREGQGVYLTPEGKRIVIAAMNDKLDTVISLQGESLSYREWIRQEVRKLVRLFRHDEKYTPFKQLR